METQQADTPDGSTVMCVICLPLSTVMLKKNLANAYYTGKKRRERKFDIILFILSRAWPPSDSTVNDPAWGKVYKSDSVTQFCSLIFLKNHLNINEIPNSENSWGHRRTEQDVSQRLYTIVQKIILQNLTFYKKFTQFW